MKGINGATVITIFVFLISSSCPLPFQDILSDADYLFTTESFIEDEPVTIKSTSSIEGDEPATTVQIASRRLDDHTKHEECTQHDDVTTTEDNLLRSDDISTFDNSFEHSTTTIAPTQSTPKPVVTTPQLNTVLTTLATPQPIPIISNTKAKKEKRTRKPIKRPIPTLSSKSSTHSPNVIARRFGVYVSDGIRGANQVREETWRGSSVTGSYGIPLGDGLWQLVRYEAGRDGFRIVSSETVSASELLGNRPVVDNEASVQIHSDDVNVGYRIKSEEIKRSDNHHQINYYDSSPRVNSRRVPAPSAFKINRIYLRRTIRSSDASEEQQQDEENTEPPSPAPSIAPRRYAFSIQDGIGGANQIREEEWKDGAISGSYVQPLGDGYWQRIVYTADSQGYRVLSTRILSEEELFGLSQDNTANVHITDDHQNTRYTITKVKKPENNLDELSSTEISEEDF